MERKLTPIFDKKLAEQRYIKMKKKADDVLRKVENKSLLHPQITPDVFAGSFKKRRKE